MAKTRSVLGKGLSALIPGANESETQQEREEALASVQNPVRDLRAASALSRPEPSVNKIEIAKVAPNPQQPRKDFPKEALEELAQSIREHGIIQAITVRKVASDRYELVSGERRVRAAIEAGLTEIPAYVLEV
jgi:ParB family chromosome partitioning protein